MTRRLAFQAVFAVLGGLFSLREGWGLEEPKIEAWITTNTTFTAADLQAVMNEAWDSGGKPEGMVISLADKRLLDQALSGGSKPITFS